MLLPHNVSTVLKGPEQGQLPGQGEVGEMPTVVIVAHYDAFGAAPVINSPPFLGVNFSLVHKRINLREDLLVWEHEQFSLRRVPAFTVSHLDSQKYGSKSTILDTRSPIDIKKLKRNTQILCEALARFMFKKTIKETPEKVSIFQGELVQEPRLPAILDWLVSQPRAAQLIENNHPLLSTIEHLFRRNLRDVKRHVFKADDREPEFVFYDQLKQTMTSHRVKPAAFDLCVALIIAAYLSVIHQAIQNFCHVYNRLVHLVAKQKYTLRKYRQENSILTGMVLTKRERVIFS